MTSVLSACNTFDNLYLCSSRKYHPIQLLSTGRLSWGKVSTKMLALKPNPLFCNSNCKCLLSFILIRVPKEKKNPERTWIMQRSLQAYIPEFIHAIQWNGNMEYEIFHNVQSHFRLHICRFSLDICPISRRNTDQINSSLCGGAGKY